MVNRPKSYASYVIDSGLSRPVPADSSQPAVAFLYEVIEISDAIRHCVHNFPRRKSGEFTAASTDSLWGLCAAAHASLMSQLESYQKALFAGLFEASRLNDEFKFELFERQLSKWNASIQLERLQNYRGDMASIGLVLADSLNGWHDPARVNSYFRAIVTSWDLFSTEDTSELAVLWQIRHSIVHTGGRLTRGDRNLSRGGCRFLSGFRVDVGFVDPGFAGRAGGDGCLVAEPFGVRGVGGVEDGLAGFDDRCGGACVDVCWVEVAER